MSQTVNELYDKLIKPTATEDAARAHFRQKKLTETLEHKRHEQGITNDRCIQYGHTPIGDHTQATSESGKVYGKCRICGMPYLVLEVKVEAIAPSEPLNDEFLKGTAEPSGPRFTHHAS